MKITVLGGGSWGSALAIHLANNNSVKIWEFFEEHASMMQKTRQVQLLPGVKFQDNVEISSDLAKSCQGSELFLLVVPSDKVESTIKNAAALIGDRPVVICSKGFESDLRLLSDVVRQYVSGAIYCLYGPTHAEEVSRGMFSGMVLAGGIGREKLQQVFATDLMRIDLSDDLVGVQVAASLKNILAILIGILDGAGYGDNTKAYAITKGVQEIKDVGIAFGAKAETFYGLAGLGDIIVTTSSVHSRNRTVGRELGKGRKLAEVLAGMSMIAEGVTTVQHVPSLQEKFNLELPLLNATYQILYQDKKITDVQSSF